MLDADKHRLLGSVAGHGKHGRLSAREKWVQKSIRTRTGEHEQKYQGEV
jgi:hypothetical protein